MKILIINTFDLYGGAARAAYRLHKALLNSGVDSLMLVQSKSSDDYTVITETQKIKKYFNKLRPIIDNITVKSYRNKTKILFSPSWFGFSDIVNKINTINPDIVHLHWICAGMIRIEDIARIKAPIVWSLHDNWAFTGGCHIMWECGKYQDQCGACPNLGSNNENDLSRKIFKRKQKTYARIKELTIVGLSRWLNSCSQHSTLFKEKRHINLPNLIDTTLFKPFDKYLTRELWKLPKDKKLVLFGAMSATSDINKGFKELTEGLHKLDENHGLEFVVFGSNQPKNAPDFGFKTHYLGRLSDHQSLVTLYNAVDIMVVPSLQENLSNAIMESLACGTPVVGFDIGGNSDMIEHKITGYLVKPFDTTDLKNGIEWILNNPNYDELCNNAREKVLREFDSRVVAKKYIDLYEEVLNAK